LPGAQAVSLNEIMTSNSGVVLDENGDSSDWVELYNPGPTALDLAGYGLTDDTNAPFKWVFTNTVLEAGQFLVVFCDGKDRSVLPSAPVDPASLPGLKVWLRADAVNTNDPAQIRVSGGSLWLRKWVDQLGGDDNAPQDSDALQPQFLIRAPGLVNRAAIRFDGLNDLLNLPAVPAQNSFCLMFVARTTVYHEVDPQAYGTGGTSGQRYLFGATHGGDFNAGAGVSIGTNGVSVYEHGSSYMPALAVYSGPVGTDFHVISVNYSNRQPFLYFQGNLARAGLTSSRTIVTAPTQIGSGAYGAFLGDVAEILIFNRALTDGEVRSTQEFLARQYGLPVRHVPHTNFSLDRDGETVQLTRPDGTVADQVPPVAMPRDVSYGRSPDGSGPFVFFTTPTPAAANTTPGSTEFLDKPVFSHEAGFYTNAFPLTLAVTNPGATIRFTLDGTEPAEFSPLYSGPIAMTNRASVPNNLSTIPTVPGGFQPPSGTVYKFNVVRAKAFKAGALPSETASRSFIVDPRGAARYSLPVVSLITDPRNFFDPNIGIYVPGNAPGGNYAQSGDDWERPVHLEMFETNGTRVVSQNSGIRIHGNTSFGFPIKALRLHPLNPPGNGPLRYQVFPDLPIQQFNRLLLRPSGHDYNLTFMRDGFMQSFGAEMGLDVQAYRPAVLFVDGEYWGVHNLQEAYEPGYFASHYGVDPEALDYLEGFAFANEGDTLAWDAMMAFLNTHDLSQAIPFTTLQSMMDVANYTDYKVCEIYFYRWDIGNHRPWRPRTPEGRFRWILFDCDVGWGGFWSVPPAWAFPMLAYDLEPNGPWTQYEQNPGGNDHNAPIVTFLLRALTNNATFRRDFVNRFADALNTTFHPPRVIRRIDEFASRIAPEMGEHVQRWRAPASLAGWSNNVQALRDFAVQRPAFMRQHLTNAFHLPATVTVTLRVNDTNAGSIRVSTITVSPPTNAPWTGIYFKANPVTLTALANPGYRFSRWTGLLDPSNSVTLGLLANVSLTANFSSVPTTNLPVPAPFDLSTGPYIFSQWNPAQPAGSYPPSMLFTTGTNLDPGLRVEFTNLWSLPYDRTNHSRFAGLGSDGVSFLNTSEMQPEGGGYLGAAVLALRTSARTNLQLQFTAGTVAPNSRVYALRLQFRVGAISAFEDALSAIGQPIEYVSSASPGHRLVLGPMDLPRALIDQPYVQLRWKYYYVGGASGPRAQLRLDDIIVAEQIPTGPVRFSGVAHLADGGIRLGFAGALLRSYTLETSTNLADWAPLGTLTTGTDGSFEFIDRGLSSQGGRFYRVRDP